MVEWLARKLAVSGTIAVDGARRDWLVARSETVEHAYESPASALAVTLS